MSWSRVIVVGLVLGVTAALVVWYLERFEVAKLHGEVGAYLDNYDRFREWLATHGQAAPPPPEPPVQS